MRSDDEYIDYSCSTPLEGLSRDVEVLLRSWHIVDGSDRHVSFFHREKSSEKSNGFSSHQGNGNGNGNGNGTTSHSNGNSNESEKGRRANQQKEGLHHVKNRYAIPSMGNGTRKTNGTGRRRKLSLDSNSTSGSTPSMSTSCQTPPPSPTRKNDSSNDINDNEKFHTPGRTNIKEEV